MFFNKRMENSSFIKNDFLQEYLMVGRCSVKAGYKILDGVFHFVKI